jgi:uncharacterized protein (TIGR04141 family)
MNTFTIFLLKDNIPDPVVALDRKKLRRTIALTGELGLPGTLFIGSQHRATPQWVNMMNPFLIQEIPAVYTASISAVLIVQYRDRLFALTFGYGRTLLAPQWWVRDFGLRATLNKVDPMKLRSVDSKIYDDMVVSTRRQTSQRSKVEAFELDISRALLRGVTGEADEHDIFTRITGSSSVQVTTELAFGDLGEILGDLLDAYTDNAYQQNFGWVDNVREVDPTMHAELDQRLIDAINAGNLAGAYLSAPEIVDWERIHRFSYTHAGDILYLELSLTDYLHVLEEHDIDVDIDALKRHRVRVQYDGDDALHDKWCIYECLVWETTLGNRRFVLIDGLWFEIAPEYATTVTNYVASITADDIPFPDAPEGLNEGQYNAGVAVQDADNFALLDTQPFVPTGAATPIEFCDLFSAVGHLIHVKKRSSSGSLSHLFSQGSVSSDLFLQDEHLRNAVRQRLIELGKPTQAALIPNDRPNSDEYEVVYAVIAPPVHGAWPPALPFFSSVNLMHHARRVQNLGFKVSLQYVRQV